MADPQYPSVPQPFTFAGLELHGYFVSFTGAKKRRSVTHEFPKRKGARVEDMDRGPQRLEVRLVFVGDDCAKRYQAFAHAVDADPYGLLKHPIAGSFNAFCEGPQEDIDLNRAVDEIKVLVSWVETDLDLAVARETPDVATAAQDVSDQQSRYQVAVATFMAELEKASTAEARALGAIDEAMAQLDVVTAPVDFMRDSIIAVETAQSTVVGKVNAIALKTKILNQDIDGLIDSTTDIFDGSEVAAGVADNVANLIGIVQSHGEDLEDELIADAVTPAGAAEAVGQIDEMIASCLVLSDALAAARPPTISYTVQSLTDVITLAQQRYAANSLARANDILSLNRIPNPSAIPAGTVLRIPAE